MAAAQSREFGFLDPAVVARIGRLELRAREIVEGFLAGRHRSPQHGRSVEFAQHREYVAGDDLRHLDWKVWAKADRLYVKQYEEETNLRATLLLDASASMAYGTGSEQKYSYACLLAAATAYLLLRQSDAVGLVCFDDRERSSAPRRSAPGHLRAILHAMVAEPAEPKTDLEGVLRKLAERETKRGLIVIFSDLFAKVESVIRGLKLLRRGGHDVIVFHVLHADEVEFPFQGTTRFEGLEAPMRLTCDPRALREDYLAALSRYRRELNRLAGCIGIDYRFVVTNQPADTVVAKLLHERSRK